MVSGHARSGHHCVWVYQKLRNLFGKNIYESNLPRKKRKTDKIYNKRFTKIKQKCKNLIFKKIEKEKINILNDSKYKKKYLKYKNKKENFSKYKNTKI